MRPVIVVPLDYPHTRGGPVRIDGIARIFEAGMVQYIDCIHPQLQLTLLHLGRLQLLPSEKSTSVRSGPRSEFLGLRPKVFAVGAA